MVTVSVTTLREKLKTYLNRVSDSFEVVLVSRSKDESDSVVIMSLKEYNALTETGYLLQSAKNRERLSESIRQHKAGKSLAPAEFNEVVRRKPRR